jgi:hypothetical protein
MNGPRASGDAGIKSTGDLVRAYSNLPRLTGRPLDGHWTATGRPRATGSTSSRIPRPMCRGSVGGRLSRSYRRRTSAAADVASAVVYGWLSAWALRRSSRPNSKTRTRTMRERTKCLVERVFGRSRLSESNLRITRGMLLSRKPASCNDCTAQAHTRAALVSGDNTDCCLLAVLPVGIHPAGRNVAAGHSLIGGRWRTAL